MQLRTLGGLSLWLWSAFSLVPMDAGAATADRCQATAICRERVAAAIELGSKGRYEEALLLYESAYEQSQEPRLLLNIGRCHYRLNRSQKALDYYEKFRTAQPEPEPELASRLAQFVAEAKLALVSQGAGGSAAKPTGAQPTDSDEPQPAPLSVAPADRPTERTTLGRPTWRVAAGLSMAGVGGALVGLGIGALAVNERCVTPSANFAGQCATELRPDGQVRALLLDGLTPGIPLVVGGGLLLAGGLVLFAWPARRGTGRALLPSPSASLASARP